jgi:hypothetical protein
VTEVRLIQAARMMGMERDEVTEQSARTAIASDPVTFADELFLEAAASDDVTSEAAALDYLEGRLAFFGDLLDVPVPNTVRTRFAERLEAWSAIGGRG